jgi:hypothetical protein
MACTETRLLLLIVWEALSSSRSPVGVAGVVSGVCWTIFSQNSSSRFFQSTGSTGSFSISSWIGSHGVQ